MSASVVSARFQWRARMHIVNDVVYNALELSTSILSKLDLDYCVETLHASLIQLVEELVVCDPLGNVFRRTETRTVDLELEDFG